MTKKQIDARVRAAMALHADRETALRELAVAVDKIEAMDAKIATQVADRNAAVAAVEAAHQTARAAGWKARELTEVNLAVPPVIDFALTTERPATDTSPDASTDTAPSEARAS